MKWKMLFIACLVASTIGVGAYRGSFLSTKSLWEDNLEPGFGLPLSPNGTIKVPPTPPIDDEPALPAAAPPIAPVGPQGAAEPGSMQSYNPFQETMCDCERAEHEARKLAEDLKIKPDPKKEAELRKMLAAVFDKKLAAQEQEARELSDKLQRLQKNLAIRQAKKNDIVENRMKDLMGLGWTNNPGAPYQSAQTMKTETKVTVTRTNGAQAGPGSLAPSNHSPGATREVRNAQANIVSPPGARMAGPANQNKVAASATEVIQWRGLADQMATVFRTLDTMKANSESAKFANDPEILKIELAKAKLEHDEAQVNADQQLRRSAQGVISHEDLRKSSLAVEKAALEVKLAELKLDRAINGQPAPATRQEDDVPAKDKENAPAKDKPAGSGRRSASAHTFGGEVQSARVVILEQIQGSDSCPDEPMVDDSCPFEAAQKAQKDAIEKARAAQGKQLSAQIRATGAGRPSESSGSQSGNAKSSPSNISMGVRLPSLPKGTSAMGNMLCAPAPSPLPAPKSLILIKSTVDEVKGRKIILSDGTECEAGAKTEIIQKTENGEKKGKLSDVKSGASIEVEMHKDSKCPKKITVSFIFSVASNSMG